MPKDLIAVARTTKYPLDAFIFVQRGLDHTVRSIHGEPADATDGADEKALVVQDPQSDKPSRHVTGRQLCTGLRDFAIEQYGLLARTVLRRWRINACEDFGHIVFAMVDAGMMNKTDEDSVQDFVDVFDFEAAFTAQLELTKKR